MKIFRISFITAILSFFILPVRSQTVCEKMQQLGMDVNQKTSAWASEGKVANDADVDYLLALLADTDKKLDKLVSGVTDKDILREYHFCIVADHGRVARILLMAEKPEKSYTVSSEAADVAFSLDDDILKNFEPVRCSKADGSANIVSAGDYQEFAANFYYCYMSGCCFLNKTEEANKLFDHFSKYDLWNARDAAYTTAAVFVHQKWATNVADRERVKASAYMLKKYTKESVRDSVAMPLNVLLRSLNDPAIADTAAPERANDLYLIYQDMEFFRLHNKDDVFITEQAQSDMFAQVMRCMTYNTNIGEFLEAMKYNNHPDVDRIIAMNDAELLNKIIFMLEKYIQRAKTLREPYFWGNIAKLYTKAGNNSAAEDALKKARKYKY